MSSTRGGAGDILNVGDAPDPIQSELKSELEA